jgi:hypothetical protein
VRGRWRSRRCHLFHILHMRLLCRLAPRTTVATSLISICAAHAWLTEIQPYICQLDQTHVYVLCSSGMCVRLCCCCCPRFATVALSATAAASAAAAAAAAASGLDRAKGPFREALVFMIGGGNYLERETLAAWASRSTPPRQVRMRVYVWVYASIDCYQACQDRPR